MSERHDGRGGSGDARAREIVRTLADSAPSAPSWDRIVERQTLDGRVVRPGSSEIARWAFVAALVLMVAGAASLFVPSDGETISTSGAAAESASWQEWIDEADPVGVQLCLTRVIGDIARDAILPKPSTGTALPGYSSEVAYLRRFQDLDVALVVLTQIAPRLTNEVAPEQAMVEQIAATERAYDALVADNGSPSADIGERVDDYLRARRANPLLQGDADECWLERDTNIDTLRDFGSNNGEEELLRCLTVAQFDHAAREASADPAWIRLLEPLAQSISVYFDPVPAEIVAVINEVREVQFADASRAPTALEATRADLWQFRATAAETTACPVRTAEL